MSREQRARALIRLMERLAVEHGTRAATRGAPPRTSSQIIHVHPAWNALLSKRASAVEAQPVSGEGERADAGTSELLPNSLDLWINNSKAFASEFDDAHERIRITRFRRGDWDAQLLEWAAAWLARGSAEQTSNMRGN